MKSERLAQRLAQRLCCILKLSGATAAILITFTLPLKLQIFSPLSLAAASASDAGESFQAKVVHVQDGDSMTVLHNTKSERLILFGVDCPELQQAFGEEAKEFTKQVCFQKTVSVETRGKDRLGRTVANVYLPDGSMLNEELLRRGLAWWSDKYAPEQKDWSQMQAKARSEKTGLWSNPKAVAPWIFRNGQKTVQAQIKIPDPDSDQLQR